MSKILFKALILTSINIAFLANAQFRTQNRMDRMEEIDFQKFSWGFFLNGNMYDYKIVLDPRFGMNVNENLVLSKPSYSFGAGLIGKIRLNEYFDLRVEPGLQFSERELRFNTDYNNQYSSGTLTTPPFIPIVPFKDNDRIRTVKNTLIDIPVMIELHGDRWYNSRPYMAGGFNYIMNLQSNAKSNDDNLQGVYRSTTHNFGWSAELGIQFYFSRFKLTPALRGTFVMNNERVADNPGTPPYWASAISTIQSRAFMFILKFE